MINGQKNIGEVKYKTLLAEIKKKQAKKHQQPRDLPVRGTVINWRGRIM